MIVALLVGFFFCSIFCCAFLRFLTSFAIILIDKRELVVLLCLSSWCRVIVVVVLCLFLTLSWVACGIS